MDKPDVDSIEGLSPGDLDRPEDDVAEPALDRRHGHRDLRLPAPALCPRRPSALPDLRPEIAGQTAEQIVEQVLELPEGDALHGADAPVVRGAQGRVQQELFEELRARASRASSVDGDDAHARRADSSSTSKCATTIEVVVDRLVMKDGLRSASPTRSRRRCAWPRASSRSRSSTATTVTFSEKFACPEHGVSLPELAPRIFTFNSPHGACPRCVGLGSQARDRPATSSCPTRRSRIAQGAHRAVERQQLELLRAGHRRPSPTSYEIDLDTPWQRPARGSSATSS